MGCFFEECEEGDDQLELFCDVCRADFVRVKAAEALVDALGLVDVCESFKVKALGEREKGVGGCVSPGFVVEFAGTCDYFEN